MRRIYSGGERGFAPVLLVIVVAWALVAVLLLTGTITAAHHIRRDVAIIRPEVNEIGTDTSMIKLAARTARISSKISAAATPLTGELTDTLTSARGIDVKAKSILRRAGSINQNARSINANVLTIGSSVGRIGANASAIRSNAEAINVSARSIFASAQSINANALSINASVQGIDTKGNGILATVRSIDPEVAGINNRAVNARGVASNIGSDLHEVLAIVPFINRHANAIDCSTLLNSAGRTRGCVR